MWVQESIVINAPLQNVWDLVSDFPAISSLIPGVQQFDRIDDTHFRLVVRKKVGFLSAAIAMRTEVRKINPPHSIELVSKGETFEGAQGTIQAEDKILLEVVTERQTRLTFYSSLNVGGQLGALGNKVIEAKVKQIKEEVTKTLKDKLEGNSRKPTSGQTGVKGWMARIFGPSQ